MAAAPEGELTSKVESLAVYSDVFLKIGLVTGVIAILMVLTAPMLNRMTLER